MRGRWMSDGLYDNMRAYIPNKKKTDVDEASDTYDTIDWLVKIQTITMECWNLGISYPGFYATYSLLSRHPALKAVSPQACISDFSLMIFTITEPIVELLKATPLLVFKDGTQCLVPNPRVRN
jgi:predicted acyl esterase